MEFLIVTTVVMNLVALQSHQINVTQKNNSNV